MASFFRLAKNKQFNYIPRYYNEQQEEMQKRKKRIAREIEAEKADSDEKVALIKGKIKSYYLQNSKKHNRQSNLRVLVVLAILLFVAYYLLVR